MCEGGNGIWIVWPSLHSVKGDLVRKFLVGVKSNDIASNLGSQRKAKLMATYCQVTGRKPQFGKTVSHSHKRTSRRFNPNLQTKRYYVPSLKRTVTITVSTKGIKTIDSRGIESVVADLIRSGEL